ncbi:MAG: SRPBCC family protein [Thaumarchaeota archaeon]|nr:SRPBCC family protein [Nitrososphaerota archaeon]
MLIDEKMPFEGDPQEVWKKVSDVERMPEFWHGTRSLKVLSRDGGKMKIKAKFAFGGTRDVDVTVDDATKTLSLNYSSGPFSGVQSVMVAGNTVEAKWDIKFNGVYRFVENKMAGHFQSGTVHALERLVGKPTAEDSNGEAIAQV